MRLRFFLTFGGSTFGSAGFLAASVSGTISFSSVD
jgi:hypothetical protein